MASVIRGNDNFDSAIGGSTTLGAVGTYAFLQQEAVIVAGNTYSASSLRYSGLHEHNSAAYAQSPGSTVSAGTWRAMGQEAQSSRTCMTVFVRIS